MTFRTICCALCICLSASALSAVEWPTRDQVFQGLNEESLRGVGLAINYNDQRVFMMVDLSRFDLNKADGSKYMAQFTKNIIPAWDGAGETLINIGRYLENPKIPLTVPFNDYKIVFWPLGDKKYRVEFTFKN